MISASQIKKAALFSTIIFLTSCTQPIMRQSAGPYTYMPAEGEEYATIAGSPIISGILNAPTGSAYITHIDGMLVPEIDDGGLQWMLYGSRMKGYQYPMTPGEHTITYELKVGTVATLETRLNAKAGESYTLKAVNEVENNHRLARFRSWIEDSEARTVAMDQIIGRE